MPAIKQLAYQRRKNEAGLCRRCGRRPRRVKDGKTSPLCEFCRASASATAAVFERRKRRGELAPTPTPQPIATPMTDAERNAAAVRIYQQRRGLCPECGNPMPYERLIAQQEFCPDCQPSIC